MGENMLVDKLYQFLCEADARRFFEGGPLAPGEHSYRDRDYIKEGVGPGSCDMGIGFDHVELYIYGRLIDMHSGGCARRPAQAARSVVLGDVP